MEQRIGIERMEEAINLFGSFDENIRLLESEFQVTVVNRGGELVISGEPENVMLAEKAVQALLNGTLAYAASATCDHHDHDHGHGHGHGGCHHGHECGGGCH